MIINVYILQETLYSSVHLMTVFLHMGTCILLELRDYQI